MKNKSLTENFSELSEVVKDYLDARIALWKISLIEKISKVGTYISIAVVLLLTFLFVLLMLSFAFSYWYGEEYGNLSEGFLIASLGYIVLALLMYILRKPIFTNLIVKNLSEIFFDDKEKNN